MSTSNSRKPDYAVVGGVLLGLVFLAGIGYAGYYVISRFVAPAVKTGAKFVGEKIDIIKLRSQIVGSWQSPKGFEPASFRFLSDGTVTAMLPAARGTREQWAGTYEITLAGKMIIHMTAVKDPTRRMDTEENCALQGDTLTIGRLSLERARP